MSEIARLDCRLCHHFTEDRYLDSLGRCDGCRSLADMRADAEVQRLESGRARVVNDSMERLRRIGAR